MADLSNPASDIAHGSMWEAIGSSRRVAVISTAAGHVRYEQDGATVVAHHHLFRFSFRPLYDRRQVKSQFSMSCANLGEFSVYWLPSHRRIIARSCSCSRRFAIPPGAVHVGVYSHPFAAEDFLEDLDSTIVKAQEDQLPQRQDRGLAG